MKTLRLKWRKAKQKMWALPPYGSRRYRLKRWLRDHRLITRARYQRELDRATSAAHARHRQELEETKKAIDGMLPRIASGLIEYDRQQQSFVLTTFLGDAVVRSLHDYPGDHDRVWEYVGERLGHEVSRQLRSLDLGTVVKGPTVLLGDRFIDPYRLRPPGR